jgi:hypothetical protein
LLTGFPFDPDHSSQQSCFLTSLVSYLHNILSRNLQLGQGRLNTLDRRYPHMLSEYNSGYQRLKSSAASIVDSPGSSPPRPTQNSQGFAVSISPNAPPTPSSSCQSQHDEDGTEGQDDLAAVDAGGHAHFFEHVLEHDVTQAGVVDAAELSRPSLASTVIAVTEISGASSAASQADVARPQVYDAGSAPPTSAPTSRAATPVTEVMPEVMPEHGHSRAVTKTAISAPSTPTAVSSDLTSVYIWPSAYCMDDFTEGWRAFARKTWNRDHELVSKTDRCRMIQCIMYKS